MSSPHITALMVRDFRTAAAEWLELNKARTRPRTHTGLCLHAKMLNIFFGDMRLKDIHIGPIMAYQSARTNNDGGRWPKLAGPSIVNHELCTLKHVLQVASLWGVIADLYKPLPLPAWEKPKVMNEAEKARLFIVAASRPEWLVAWSAAVIAGQTSAAGTELRHLQLEDVILDVAEPRVVIKGGTAKNNHRGRTIQLTPAAQEAFRVCLERAQKIGSARPEHYLFPFRVLRNQWDPTRPASDGWIKGAWNEMREAAGLPWITPHCLRFQCITELAEKGVAPEMIRHIAGWSSTQMLNHYSRCRHEQQAAALSVLAPPPGLEKRRGASTAPQRTQSRVPAGALPRFRKILRGRRAL